MRIGLKFISSLTGLVLIAAVALSTAWNMGKTASDWGLPTLLPDDPDIALAASVADFRIDPRAPARSSYNEAKAAAGLDPVEEEPLLLASLVLNESGHETVIQLLSEARRRNPAAREVRILLLDRHLRAGNMTGAVGEIAALSKLLPAENRSELSQLLLSLVAKPETRYATIAALRRNLLRKELISKLAQGGASSFLLLDLSKDLTPLEPGSEDAKWSQTVTQAFVDQGDVEGANRLWSHFFGVSPNSSSSGVFDKSFRGSGAPPFGWLLQSRPGAYAQLERDGLRIRYDGRDSAMFARELLMLPSGRYKLGYKLEAAKGALPNLAWRIDCLKSGGTILDLSINQMYSFEANQSPEFTVPSDGCPAQWIALSGRSMPSQSMRSALFRTVDVGRVHGE